MVTGCLEAMFVGTPGWIDCSAVQAATDAQRQLHALVIAAPEALHGRLRSLTTPAWSPPAPGCANAPTGTPRPPRLRLACVPWPAASNSWTPRPPSTPVPCGQERRSDWR